MNKLPFDLEAAKNGAKLVTRDGREAVFVAYDEVACDGSRVIARISGADRASFFYDSGLCYDCIESESDLFLLQETRSINGYEYPAPMTEVLDDGSHYYVALPASKDLFAKIVWSCEEGDFILLKRGLCHTTPEAAIAHARAIILAGGGEV